MKRAVLGPDQQRLLGKYLDGALSAREQTQFAQELERSVLFSREVEACQGRLHERVSSPEHEPPENFDGRVLHAVRRSPGLRILMAAAVLPSLAGVPALVRLWSAEVLGGVETVAHQGVLWSTQLVLGALSQALVALRVLDPLFNALRVLGERLVPSGEVGSLAFILCLLAVSIMSWVAMNPKGHPRAVR